jgi:Ribose/xylose/arabinose/galactoside ABC-type transport systems, permease components
MNANAKYSFRNIILNYGIYIAFIIICIIFAVPNTRFLSVRNFENILIQSSVIAIAAIGQTFVIFTGGIDLSVGTLIGSTGILVGLAASNGVGIPGLILIGLLVGLVLGLINGFLIGYINIPPFITTLGTQGICLGVSLVLSQGRPFSTFPRGFDWMGTESIGPIPFLVFIMVVLYCISWIFSTRTKTGRYILSIGGNREAVRLSGVNVQKNELIAYLLCSLLSAFAGVLLVSRLNFASPTAGTGFELETIASVVIGGTMMTGGAGSVLKTFLGAVLLFVLKNGLTLNNVSPYYQMLVTGVIIILAVFLDTLKNKKKV